VGLEWGPPSLVGIIEELFLGNIGSGLENGDYRLCGRKFISFEELFIWYTHGKCTHIRESLEWFAKEQTASWIVALRDVHRRYHFSFSISKLDKSSDIL
jgi:hypothetical protein